MTAFLNGIQHATAALWSQPTLYLLLGAGLLFTAWTRIGQFRILSHGFRVVRGEYDNPDDPGAINHFQALSAALSATIGLGNIGGVAIAIGLGGPGALFWMWVVGFFGIALKTVEITLTMLYRNTDDPDDPHGGPMWVIDRTLGRIPGPRRIAAKCLGGLFSLSCIFFTVVGICLFQTWNVADITNRYFGVPQVATGSFVAVLVGLVIIGGIRRIGQVAGKLVPAMAILYLLSAAAVVAVNMEQLPSMFRMILTRAFAPTEAGGAFVGAGAWLAFTWGLKRAIYSNEAGLGSAAMAHAAARTNEPAREGIVGGLGPLIDTLIICTLTALVILITGAWNRPPEGPMHGEVTLSRLQDRTELIAPTDPRALPELPAWDSYTARQQVFFVVSVPDDLNPSGRRRVRVYGTLETGQDGEITQIAWRNSIEDQNGETISLPAGTRWIDDDGGRPIKGLYREFTGAALTAHAFDRSFPG
ncbi:MAG: amino acid carrier protein, partial [Planctomycetes bacterium]|nr:amino acid carrier protein [Planctomycetota bacterium]